MDRVETMMKEFTEATGVSGSEEEIFELMRGHLGSIAETEKDRLGCFIAKLRGKKERPRVMLVAHMDEIGLMVSHFQGNFIRFNALGGWWPPRLIGMPVRVRTSRGDVYGVVNGKSPFHMEREEREKPIRTNELFIDVGCTGKQKPGSLGIRPGDPVVPHFPFTILKGGKTYMAKAWDNRIGCVIVIETMRRLAKADLPNTIYGVGTVQEEVGIRGAVTSSRRINPDVCFALDVNIAQDIPASPEGSTEHLGAGVSICVYDATLIPNTRLRDLVVSVAEKKKIPYHYSAVPYGGTDGGRVHLNEYGVPTLVIAVPTRYIHSTAGIIHRKDFDSAVRLIAEVAKVLDGKTVEGLV
ncbi:MAG TPA: M42 family metallopeptidase [Patescibacteria group bacterium]|nr:M42 family metallopeptidase [Patescibacteria group bacterium]